MRSNYELLEAVRTRQISDDDLIQELLDPGRKEDLHLEYKQQPDWKKTTKKKMAGTVRAEIAAFLNSDGGLLVLGISEDGAGHPNGVTSFEVEGGQTTDEWVRSLVSKLSPIPVPLPDIRIVDHEDGPVFVVAMDRTDGYVLVPGLQGQEGGLHLRIRLHDEKYKVTALEEWLLRDLLTRRRRRLTLSIPRAEVVIRGPQKIELNLDVRNDSLEHFRLIEGAFVWMADRGLYREISPNLRRLVSIDVRGEPGLRPMSATVPINPGMEVVAPFSTRTIRAILKLAEVEDAWHLHFGVVSSGRKLLHRIALVLLPVEHQPVVFQLEMELPAPEILGTYLKGRKSDPIPVAAFPVSASGRAEVSAAQRAPFRRQPM